MGFRFRKQKGLGKLFRVNLTRNGLGFQVGPRTGGARIGVSPTGKVSVGASDGRSGLSWTRQVGDIGRSDRDRSPRSSRASNGGADDAVAQWDDLKATGEETEGDGHDQLVRRRVQILGAIATGYRPARYDGVCALTGRHLEPSELLLALHPGGYDVVAADLVDDLVRAPAQSA
jgi:hypothetical protein